MPTFRAMLQRMSARAVIGNNQFVTLQYVLKDDEGDIVDTSEGGDPIEYVHGYGMLVPGLESRLLGLEVGTEKLIIVPADEAFGEYDDDLVVECARNEFPSTVEVGDEFVAEDAEGDETPMTVVEVDKERVVVDGNHPLAGQQLHYQVKVESVRDATTDEIKAAAEAFDEARDASGVEDPERAGLVTLGRGPKANLPN